MIRRFLVLFSVWFLSFHSYGQQQGLSKLVWKVNRIDLGTILQEQGIQSVTFDYTLSQGAAFAIEEKTAVFHEHQNLTEQQIKDKIKALSIELKVVETLNAYKVTTKAIIDENKSDKATRYCLVILNIDAKSLSVTYYPKNLLKSAVKLLAEKEREAENQNKSILPLLVSVNDVKKLPRAYPNYYLDTSNFIGRLKEITK